MLLKYSAVIIQIKRCCCCWECGKTKNICKKALRLLGFNKLMEVSWTLLYYEHLTVYYFNDIMKTLISIFWEVIWLTILPSLFITGSNQPPRFLNYFFSTYLLIYEDMPVGESLWSVSMLYFMSLHYLKEVQWSCLCGFLCQLVYCTEAVSPCIPGKRKNNK